ncbi:hypothetical protein MRX96_018638 [Rhipicephalus microplus]
MATAPPRPPPRLQQPPPLDFDTTSEDIFVTFNLSAEDSKKFELVKKNVDEYFIKETSVLYESACFQKRHQMPVRTEDGVTLRRNRRMLNRMPQQASVKRATGKREGSYEFPNKSESADFVSTETSPPAASTSTSVPTDSEAVISTSVLSASVTVTRSGRVVKRQVCYGIDE